MIHGLEGIEFKSLCPIDIVDALLSEHYSIKRFIDEAEDALGEAISESEVGRTLSCRHPSLRAPVQVKADIQSQTASTRLRPTRFS